jgi:beta-phosphoglucomutase-like phosphatase (HAD superfamily)
MTNAQCGSAAIALQANPFPLAEAVERLSAAGLGVCVASQGKLEKIRLSLGLTVLRHLFPDRALFSAESVPHGKPEGHMYILPALERTLCRPSTHRVAEPQLTSHAYADP